MTSWAQESAEVAPAEESPESEASGEESPEAPPAADDTGGVEEESAAPPADAGAGRPPPPMRRNPARSGMPRQMKGTRCETWELAVWNPRKSGCAAQPDALGEDWCPVPEGMSPVQPVGDTNKWWVKRCADPAGAGGPPQPPPGE